VKPLRTGDLVKALTRYMRSTHVTLYAQPELQGNTVGAFEFGMLLGTHRWFEDGEEVTSACVIDSKTGVFGWCLQVHVREAK
jgi:hypothetical protein